ncbi:hypothetical protein T10_11019 [Trichinella papuae]|uniref:Uncharacterized protein n=1 Tax=Trichinella papuae TaxID=268474 RepID=A0A0V1M3U1_9BILA|nr:hypothetical protein T10_11019 [Trichinella papuae]
MCCINAVASSVERRIHAQMAAWPPWFERIAVRTSVEGRSLILDYQKGYCAGWVEFSALADSVDQENILDVAAHPLTMSESTLQSWRIVTVRELLLTKRSLTAIIGHGRHPSSVVLVRKMSGKLLWPFSLIGSCESD